MYASTSSIMNDGSTPVETMCVPLGTGCVYSLICFIVFSFVRDILFNLLSSGCKQKKSPRQINNRAMLFNMLRANLDFAAGLAELASLTPAKLAVAADSSPKGSGPVVLIPGFCGPELSLSVAKSFLSKIGYAPATWGLGVNFGPKRFGGAAAVIAALSESAERFGGGEKVALVGQSLGGVYARELAKARPELVSGVVTLGAPVNLAEGVNSAVEVVFRLVTGRSGAEHAAELQGFSEEPWVPTVAVYSEEDSIVGPSAAVPKGGRSVRVRGSHCGMGFNPAALVAVAEALASFDKQR